MKTANRQSQNLQKVALTISENEVEKLVNAPKRTIHRRNRNRQHSNRFWQDLRDVICDKVKGMSNEIYTAILTAKTNHKKHTTRDQVIKNQLDKMMK